MHFTNKTQLFRLFSLLCCAALLTACASPAPAAPAATAGNHAASALATIQHDFTLASQLVFYALAGIMAVGFLVAARGMARGIPDQVLHSVDAEPALEPLVIHVS